MFLRLLKARSRLSRNNKIISNKYKLSLKKKLFKMIYVCYLKLIEQNQICDAIRNKTLLSSVINALYQISVERLLKKREKISYLINRCSLVGHFKRWSNLFLERMKQKKISKHLNWNRKRFLIYYWRDWLHNKKKLKKLTFAIQNKVKRNFFQNWLKKVNLLRI